MSNKYYILCIEVLFINEIFTVPRCVKRWLLERPKFEVAIVEEWFFVNSEFPWIFLLSPESPSDWYTGRSILCSWKYYVGCFKTFRQFSIWNYLLRSLRWKFSIHINAHVSNILLQFIFYHSFIRDIQLNNKSNCDDC